CTLAYGFKSAATLSGRVPRDQAVCLTTPLHLTAACLRFRLNVKRFILAAAGERRVRQTIARHCSALLSAFMKWKVYVETSVISYLTSRMSRDLIVAGHQQITQEWWGTHHDKFELFVSQPVLEEASVGDQEAAQQRLHVLETLPGDHGSGLD